MVLRIGFDPYVLNHESGFEKDIRYKVLWIGEIAKHKGIGETKVLQGKEKAKILWIYWLP